MALSQQQEIRGRQHMRANHRYRLLIGSGVFGVLSVLAACGSQDGYAGQTAAAATATPVPPIAKMGETITRAGVSCTLLSAKPLPNSTLEAVPDGRTWLVVHVQLHNTSASQVQYSANYFKVVEGSGRVDGSEPPAIDNYSAFDGLYTGTLTPGDSITGALFFEVAAGDAQARLIWTPGDDLSESTQNAWLLGL
jgi:hypothetical protein